MSQVNSKPVRTAPLVMVRDVSESTVTLLALIPALILSAAVNAGIIALLFLLSSPTGAAEQTDEKIVQAPIQADSPEEQPKVDPFTTTDVDPVAKDFDTDINYDNARIAEVSIPGPEIKDAPIGMLNGDPNAPQTSVSAPLGIGTGQGGGVVVPGIDGSATSGPGGGYLGGGKQMAGSIFGRSGSTREKALREGGGTKESEAAVAAGLQWLARTQQKDGSWKIDGNARGDDIAGTAFGLLPFLGAGHTHKKSKENPYDKPVLEALNYLKRRQDPKTGSFGATQMYSHGLAAIALCEAYGLTQDPALRLPAQKAINYIINAQHTAGGWRYSPGQPGDTSVVGWQVMALKSAQMSGLDVPEATMRKAIMYLDHVCNTGNEGYGYIDHNNPTPTMTAVGLLCRQYLQSWGPQNIRMITGIEKFIMPHQPSGKKGRTGSMYMLYYATQVLHHFGGDSWKTWNEKMRDQLVANQDKDKNSIDHGSWDPKGDGFGAAGGRIMITSLCLLTLEVYYRHLPLYYRDGGEKMNP